MEKREYGNMKIWKYGNMKIWKYGKKIHIYRENEMFMQCLMMGISVVKGKGVWNNRKNEKYGKIVLGKQGEYYKV